MVVQKKSVYPLRLLDSNDTRLLKVWGLLMLVMSGGCWRVWEKYCTCYSRHGMQILSEIHSK